MKNTIMTVNGVGTTTALGQEQYETFKTKIGRNIRTKVAYDYRWTDGELFSCVKSTLDECRTARDLWLESKLRKLT